MEDDTNDDFDWTRHSKSTKTDTSGPRNDHTQANDQGYYMYIETSDPRVKDDVARLFSPILSLTEGSTLTFWYHMFGEDVAQLRVKIEENILWQRTGPQGDVWLQAAVYLPQGKHKLIFEATRGVSYRGDIAIDDITVTRRGKYSDTHECRIVGDDEVGICVEDCTQENATTNTEDSCTGDTLCCFNGCGHACEKGKYSDDHVCRPVSAGKVGACVEACTQKNITRNTKDSCTGDTMCCFNGCGHTCQIGDPKPSPEPSTVSPLSEVSFSCDFDGGNTCASLENDLSGDFTWTWNKGSTKSGDTGPTKDYTCSCDSGGYLYIEASTPRVQGDRAMIYASLTPLQDTHCLTFAYHMWGSDIGSLWVSARSQSTNTTLFTRTGNQANLWYSQSVDIAPSVTRIDFGATTGSGWRGDIALDGISLQQGACAGQSGVTTTSPSSTKTTFKLTTTTTLPPTTTTKPSSTTTKPSSTTTKPSSTTKKPSSTTTKPSTQTSTSSSYQTSQSTVNGVTSLQTDFESGFNGLLHDPNGDFNWTITKGETPSHATGPTSDHTLGTSEGHYAYIETSGPQVQGQKARLMTPMLTSKGTGNGCLVVEFVDMLYGIDVDTLTVYIKHFGQSEVSVYSVKGNRGKFWHNVKLTQSGNAFQLIFEGTVGHSFRGDIAIDDLSIRPATASEAQGCIKIDVQPVPSTTPPSTTASTSPTTPPTSTTVGSVASSVSCNFDSDMCGFTNATGLDFKWSRSRSKTPSSSTGPTSDHTSGTGYFMFIETSSPRVRGDTAGLLTPLLSIVGSACFKMYYHMYGSSTGALRVINEMNQQTLWIAKGDQGNRWLSLELQLQVGVYRLQIQGETGDSFRGDIAIDDIEIRPGLCVAPTTISQKPTQQSQKEFFICNFETTTCNFSKNLNDDFDWFWQQRETPSSGTGPYNDHTLGQPIGHFIFVEASPTSVSDLTPELTSPNISVDQVHCLVFHYHAYGEHIGKLSVYRRESTTKQELIYSITPSGLEQRWKEVKVKYMQPGTYRVVFQPTVLGFRGDLAIDDVMVLAHCNEEVNDIPASPVFKCTMEEASCSIKNTGQFDWSVGQGATGQSNTGPTTDATYKNSNGHYLYINTQFRNTGDKARLQLPSIKDGSAYLHFNYHMYGQDINTLTVYLNEGAEVPIWSMKGDQGNTWHQASIPVTGTAKYSLTIEATAGRLGEIAIDDIMYSARDCLFNETKCNNSNVCIPIYKKCDHIGDCPFMDDEFGCPCRSDEFQCGKDGVCIQNQSRCDGVMDCIGGEDENGCGQCGSGKFKCRNYECIAEAGRCDGIKQCKDESDEQECVRLNIINQEGDKRVEVYKNQAWLPVCSNTWGTEHSQAICTYLGQGNAASTTGSFYTTSKFIQISSSSDSTELIAKFKVADTCPDDQVVHLSCAKAHCGVSEKSNPLVPLIIGGGYAKPGRWPWQLSLSYYTSTNYFCGAVLIDKQWALTAGHCIRAMETYSFGKVRTMIHTGQTVRGQYEQVLYISDYWHHPDLYLASFAPPEHDLTLIRFTRPVTYTERTYPICLPELEQQFASSLECYTTGFGYKKPAGPASNELLEIKTNVWTDNACSKIYRGLVNTDSVLCVGYSSGIIVPCNGDSGGPLVCRSSTNPNKWTLAGVTSFSPVRCVNENSSPAGFVKVASYIPWITQTMKENPPS
ncbi:unnamed protein product [Owenia fusiformis]|uniref:Uncharacterized protein n=1 Tax=Owenia fusiformis TaxID=6347 RepID=A0A8S4NB78_OWEFU|nr:unnamed protein product [Owenia fusiformis]